MWYSIILSGFVSILRKLTKKMLLEVSIRKNIYIHLFVALRKYRFRVSVAHIYYR